jgi:hypothetical protein
VTRLTAASPSKIAADIRELANEYAKNLKSKIDGRVTDMEGDDKSHYLIYQVLGVSDKEGKLIDIYQNKGRFLYKYAGGFLERAAKLCFIERFPGATSIRIQNSLGRLPRTFEIDCLVGNSDAHEIKWRDATTDGDHITKEHTRLQVIAAAGYTPIRVMFYYPNRDQAVRIQKTIETLYSAVGGSYHCGDAAWDYIRQYTDVDLKSILDDIAKENVAKWQTSLQ